LACGGVLAAALLLAASAGAATSGNGLYVHGAGNGHGVGMSQYGAAGYALHGADYRTILHDYYVGTTLGHVDPNRAVTVLLRPRGSAVFSGAATIKGSPRKLNPLVTYSVAPAGGGRMRIRLGRKSVGSFAAPLQVGGPGPLKLIGLGSFRGTFVFRPSSSGNGVMTVNAVGLDDYVRGVVSAEMPSDWPAQALAAQAVAARTYAVTSKPTGADFDVYDNTRSQMYEGVNGETSAGDAAVAATSGEVVEYAGVPVVTYFFASSGGQTESDQNVFPIAPSAWLVGRPDPYDDAYNNPYHRWKVSFSLRAAQKRLGNLVDGSLIGIRVLQRGVSPRIIRAKVVGTRGAVIVTGLQLRTAFGTPSTWMSFTTVSSHGVRTSTTPAVTTTLPTTTGTTPTGTTTSPSGGGGLIRRTEPTGLLRAAAQGALFAEFERTSSFIRHIFAALRIPTTSYLVRGAVFPAPRGARVVVERDRGGRWRRAASGRTAARGRYSVQVRGPGRYRVLFDGTSGPVVTVR
jgi:stage II sporulation protein D